MFDSPFVFECYCCGLMFSSLVTLFSPATSVALASIACFSSSDRTGPFKRYLTVLRNDLDVVCVGGERFVFHDGLSYLLRDVAVRTIVLLLIRGRLILALIPFVNLGIVWRRRGRLASWFLRIVRPLQLPSSKTGAQKIANSISVNQLSSLFPPE